MRQLATLEAAELSGQCAGMSAVPGATPIPEILKAGLPPDVSTTLLPMDFLSGAGPTVSPPR
jgi:hypothetical protein